MDKTSSEVSEKITETVSNNISGIMSSEIRLLIFFIFLGLIAFQIFLVLHIEQKIANIEGFYSKRKHPKEDSKK